MSTNGTMNPAVAAMMKRHKSKGFKLSCPCCGENEVTINLDLSNLTTCHCESCGDDFAVSTAVKILADRLAQWERVAQWIDLAADLAAPSTTESD